MDREKYLLRKYGKTLEWYESTLAKQGGGCAICGSKPITRALPIDHDHKVLYYKIKTVKEMDGMWHAFMPKLNIWARYPKKNAAIQAVRQQAKGMACRGIICFSCNGGLRKFRDNEDYLLSASNYVKKYKRKLED